MPTIASLVSIVPPAAPPAPPPAPPEPGEKSPFAKLLTAHKPASEASKTDDERSGDAAADKGAKGTKDAAHAEADSADKTDKADKADKDKAEPKTKADGASDQPALAEMLAALNRPDAVPVTPAGTAAAAGTTPLALDGHAAHAAADSAAGHSRADRASKEKFSDLAAASTASAASGDDSAAKLVQALDAADDKLHPAHAGADLPALRELHGAAPQALMHTAARSEAGSVAAPVVVAMSTPATAPEFREALGAQVSVLTRDGVQHAQLHLNPADMGPISVQIALDGTQAHVNFGADSTATRQIIESGLPELAAALRDAGFTLSGGGVSQHSRGQSDGGDSSGRSGSGSRGDDSVEMTSGARRVNVRLAQGAVDLYA